MTSKKTLTILVLLALLLSFYLFFFQLLLVVHYTPEQTITARATTGQTSFCLNQEPSIDFPCNSSVLQNDNFYCQLNVTDGDDQQNVTVTQSFVTGGQVIFQTSLNGTINFTPSNDDVGDYFIRWFATDNSSCSNDEANVSTSFTVINVNDPPYLVLPLPDVRINVNTSVSAFFLNDHFADPDGDELNYTYSALPDGIFVTIGVDSEVIFSSPECDDDGETMRFTAWDPYGASAASNIITIFVTCNEQGGGTDGDTSGTGGGSGGGASYICISEWTCQEWYDCLPTGFQWQRCYDTQGCEVDKYFKRPCEYVGENLTCVENWLCEQWGPCYANATQSRTCEDLSACGSTILKPELTQGCVYIPTCFDGIQNGNETGVDCGGPCPACALVEQPSPISKEVIATWLLILIILAILIGTVVLKYYRGEVAQVMATLGFLMRHYTYKEILLTAAQRKELFEQIQALDDKVKDSESLDPNAIYGELSSLIRTYFVEALVLPTEMVQEEIEERCERFNLHDTTKQMLLGLFQKLEFVEQEEIEFDEYFVLALLEELRTTVCMTSDFKQDEITRQIYDIPITEDMSFYDELFVRTVNILRGIQFEQYELAKKEYINLLQIYEPLTLQEKESVYPALQWTFRTVKLATEMMGSRIVKKPKELAI
ncbi:hypothetical protein GOV11_04370 [Candidatus Woesearchaeota archaeon]|nr:hypothetical protein [Candidatus Woesearchaeota archaeon]